MPLALDPMETFDVTLESDAKKPEAERATFRFRYLTLRQWRRSSWLMDDAERVNAMNGDTLLSHLLSAIADGLTGWTGLPVDFSADALPDMLTVSEAWELFYKSRRQSRVSVTEKNSSGLQSAGSTDASAPVAPPAESAATK